MKLQLRTYTIQPGALEAFVAEWKTQLVPLREHMGFRVLEAYTLSATNQFVWVMGFDGEDWDAADRAYFESPERKEMTPNPARLIERMKNEFIERIR
jgi:antibiotic biosynthesis monooxygenase (ABM) superfamily enzyme